MADMVTKKKLEDADIDVENLGKAVNEFGVVNPRYGNPFDSLPLAIQKVMEAGGFQPFLTQAALLASIPTTSPKAAKALDTKKVFYWNGTQWSDTGLSELDMSKLYSDVVSYKNIGKAAQSFLLDEYNATTTAPYGTGDLFALQLKQKSAIIDTVMLKAQSVGGLSSFTVALYLVDIGMKIQSVLGTYTLTANTANFYYVSGLNITVPDGQYLAVGIQTGVKLTYGLYTPGQSDGFFYATSLGASAIALASGFVPTSFQNLKYTAGIGVRGSGINVKISYPDLCDTLSEQTEALHSYSGTLSKANANGEVYVSTVDYPNATLLGTLTVNLTALADTSKTSFKVRPYFVDKYTREVRYAGTTIDFPIESGKTKYTAVLNIAFPQGCYFALGVETGVDLGYYSGAGGNFGYSATVANSLTLAVGSRHVDKQTIGGKPSFIYTVTNKKIMAPADYVKKSELIGGYMANYLYGKKIVAIGDSMVQGHSLSDAANQTWLAKLANRNGMTRVNYGLNGTYLSNKLYGTSEGAVVRYTAMDNDADYILVFAGTNDARNSAVPMGTDESNDTTTFKGALNVLCDGLITKYPNKKIGFITPYLRDTNYPPYVDAIETICAKYGIPVFNNIKNGGVCWTNAAQLSSITLNDTYHLNESGMDYVSRKYEEFIRSL